MDNVIIAAKMAVADFSALTSVQDNIFTSIGFARFLLQIANLKERTLDGNLVHAILCNRSDIYALNRPYYVLLYDRPDLKLKFLLT